MPTSKCQGSRTWVRSHSLADRHIQQLNAAAQELGGRPERHEVLDQSLHDPFNIAVNAIVNEQATTGSYDVAGTDLLPFTIVFTPAFSATPKTASLTDLAFPGTGPCGFNPATMAIGCATPAYAEPFRHYDGIHPNTLYMGVIGNQIITNVNTSFGFAMQTITEAQLLDTAGL